MNSPVVIERASKETVMLRDRQTFVVTYDVPIPDAVAGAHHFDLMRDAIEVVGAVTREGNLAPIGIDPPQNTDG